MELINPINPVYTGSFTRASVATYVNSSGLIAQAAVNGLRTEYTTGKPFTLLESSATNLVLQSSTQENGSWAKSNGTISVSTELSLDGVSYSRKFVENSGSGAKQLYQGGLTTSSGTAYTYSFYAKAAGRSKVYVELSSAQFSSGSAYFDLVAGNYTQTGSATASMTLMKNGWWRCKITSTAIQSISSTGCDMRPSLSIGDVGAYTGDGTSGYYIWGVQFEVGQFATSYIPTTTAAVTRSADVMPMGTYVTNAVDTAVALWNVATAYIKGDQVRLDTTHKIYECLLANTGASPDVNLTGTTPKWLLVGATNSYAMFDDKFGTQTTATSSLTVVLTPNMALDSLALLNLIGKKVEISCSVNGNVIYSKTIPLQTDIGVYDWYTYFLAPIVAEDDVVVQDLLPYNTQVITIVLTGTGTVAIGNITIGATVPIGELQYNATAGIISYSKKDVDAYGNTVVVKRPYSKRFSGKVVVADDYVDQAAALLASIRDVPIVWIGAGSKYSSLIVWGFFKDFEIDIAYPTLSYCSITIEGIV